MSVKGLPSAGFAGRVLEPTSPEFVDASRRFSAISQRKARFIVFPRTAEDVSAAVIFDMSDLKYVNIDKLNDSVHVAGGCVWDDVYFAHLKEGLACVGGGVHNVGVGCHLTGGQIPELHFRGVTTS